MIVYILYKDYYLNEKQKNKYKGEKMVEILKQIPEKQATMVKIPKGSPIITGSPGEETIEYCISGDFGDETLIIPSGLNQKFLQKCNIGLKPVEQGLSVEEVVEKIEEVNQEKDLFLRFAGDKPLSVVTSRFTEIKPSKLAAEAAKIIGINPTVRYFRNNESLQFNFPVETRFKGINLVINTGDYGTFGGSGLTAVNYGLSWYNTTCTNWTLFLNKTLRQSLGRVLHVGNSSLDESLTQMFEITSGLGEKIDESKSKIFTFGEMDRYFTQYEVKGLNKKMADQIRKENPRGMTSYDLSYRLTQLCQDNKLSDVTRARIEYLAGEVILCYDSIKNGLDVQPRVRTNRTRNLIGEKNYVSLN